MPQGKELRLTILMVLAMVTWGLSWTNAKILGDYGNAQLIMLWRFFFATLSFAPVVWWSGNSYKISRGNIRFIAANALCMVSYNYFYFKGTQIGFAGAGGVLVTTLNPILTALFSGLLFGGVLFKKDWLGLFLGLTGGGCIIRIWELDLGLLLQSGNLYFLMASLSWVSVTIITSKSKNLVPFITYSFWSFTLAFVFSLFLAINEPLLKLITFGWIFWLNLILLAVVAMSFGTSIYFQASVKLGPKRASAYIFMVPITAMGFAMYFLNEPLQLSTLMGGALGIVAVYLINK